LPEPRVDDTLDVRGQAVRHFTDAHPQEQGTKRSRQLAGDRVIGGVGFGLETADEVVQVVDVPQLAPAYELFDLVHQLRSHPVMIPQSGGIAPVASWVKWLPRAWPIRSVASSAAAIGSVPPSVRGHLRRCSSPTTRLSSG